MTDHPPTSEDSRAAALRVAAAVDGDRVLRRLEELARFGRQPDGGVTRPAFSEEEAQANDLFAGWMRDAGLTVAYDDFGNMFGSTDGNAPSVTVVAAGSHLDSVPHGGVYDGPLGCVGALEAVEALRAAGVAPRLPLELAVWRCEEPVRFPSGRVGSQVFMGDLAIADLLAQGAAFGMAGWLARERGRPRRAPGRALGHFLELHIEQGRRLEDSGEQIGIVTAVAAPTRLRVEIAGAADHSGATPMGLRRDALCAAAELVLAVERAGFAERERDSVATAVTIAAEPGALNVVPGRAELFLDVRGTDAASVERIIARIGREGEEVAARRNVAIRQEILTRAAPVIFDEAVIAVVEEAAQALGYATLRMPSGAGHDAMTVARAARAGMLFVPSAGGVSHAPGEYTPPDDVVRGVRALAAAWTRLALEG